MDRLAPHTLITLSNYTTMSTATELPNWADEMLAVAPVVVVRRGPQTTTIPVGVRGYEKSQRLAATVKMTEWTHPVTPEKALTYLPQLSAERAQLPAFQKLRRIQPLLAAFNWGVGGSLQFELATGLPMVRATSDIDIIMQRPVPMTPTQALALINQLRMRAGAHADIQIVHGQTGFSLEEYATQRAARVLVKTADGPVLMRDPWQRNADE